MLHVHFCKAGVVAEAIKGKRICLVGSGPNVESNPEGFIDSHDVVVRVNNYKLTGPATGHRTDVFYSFFGTSVRKSVEDLKRDGVSLCINKCPNSQPIISPWHKRNKKMAGVDFRYIYTFRQDWWFCDTYVPSDETFMENFRLLDGHIPTTGFSALLDLLRYEPRHIHMTGFDFFSSGVHNVNEPWKAKNNGDPIGHVPEKELQWLKDNLHRLPVTIGFDS